MSKTLLPNLTAELRKRTKPKRSGEGSMIRTNDGKLMIDKANVIKTDTAVSNGLICVIDTIFNAG